VLKRIFGYKTEEVTAGFRKVHKEDFIIYILQKYLSAKIKKDQMDGKYSGGDEKCVQNVDWEV
jgi:hypothetical protein